MDSHATIKKRRERRVKVAEYDEWRENGGPRRPDPEEFISSSEAGTVQEEGPSVSKLNFERKSPSQTVIKVLGVGGGGCNAVQSMIDQGFEGVEFYGINTDFQALQQSQIPNRIQIGENLTNGSGAGAIPSIGEQAAREAEEKLRDVMTGADMIFITAGLGGGTGTGAAPVIAEIARSMNILNVAIVTKPFTFEGMQRMRRANEGARKLSECVDTMITILNDKLMEVVGPKTPLTEAFHVANHVLAQGIRAISDLIAVPGLINVDFRDVRTIMGETGGAVMGVGIGKGENRAVEAVRKACHSPLQEKIVIDGAKGVLINITGPPDVTMHEINEATSLIYEMADPDANVIFGVVVDEEMRDAMRVTIIATGFGDTELDEGFNTARAEKLRRRDLENPLVSTNVGADLSIDSSSDSTAAEEASPAEEGSEASSAKPAILAKREREARAPRPKIDFSSDDNPLGDWGPPSDSKPTVSASSEAGAGSELGSDARILSDSEPNGDSPASGDPYYETPAIERRRRPHFFE